MLPSVQHPTGDTPSLSDSTGSFAFSGHQSFALRIPWLPKAVEAVIRGQDPFSDTRKGTEILGVGKNMVEALNCWVEFFCVLEYDEKGKITCTEFGRLVLDEDGYDPYLEDEQTLWLLHWHAVTRSMRKLFAWQWLFNLHAENEFTYNEALLVFKKKVEGYPRPLSDVTLKQHLDALLNTYLQSPTTELGIVAEDALDSPLAALGLIQQGESRQGINGKDTLYLVDVGLKQTISDELFRFSLHDWWNRFQRKEGTVGYRDICHAENSPGRVFRIPEREIHERLQRLAMEWPKEFSLIESNNQRKVRRTYTPLKVYSLLRDVYHRGS
jgi:hypothetical protein